MPSPLGKGLGALIGEGPNDGDTSSSGNLLSRIREKEKKLEELSDDIERERKSIEDMRKKLTIQLMLEGKVDKKELFQREDELDKRIRQRETLKKDIDDLRMQMRAPSTKVMSVNQNKTSKQSPEETVETPKEEVLDDEDLDMRMVQDLMTPVGKGEKGTEDEEQGKPRDEKVHKEELRRELDNHEKAREIRKEAYGEERDKGTTEEATPGGEARSPPPAPPVKPKMRRIKAPKRVRVLKSQKGLVRRSKDDRMYVLIEEAVKLMEQKRYGDSREVLEKALEEYPMDDELLYHLGNLFFVIGDLEMAQERFKKAIEKNPRSHRAYNNLGVVLRKKGEKEAAIRALNHALEIDPKYERAWMNLGSIFMEIEPPLLKEASIFLRRAIEVNPGYKKAKIKLKECQEMMEGS